MSKLAQKLEDLKQTIAEISSYKAEGGHDISSSGSHTDQSPHKSTISNNTQLQKKSLMDDTSLVFGTEQEQDQQYDAVGCFDENFICNKSIKEPSEMADLSREEPGQEVSEKERKTHEFDPNFKASILLSNFKAKRDLASTQSKMSGLKNWLEK